MTDEERYKKVSEWWELETPEPLHQFLGMTKKEYYEWIKPKIAEATTRKGSYLFNLAVLSIAVAIFCCFLITIIYLKDTKEDIAKLCTTTIIILNATVQVIISFISSKISNS